MPHLSKLLFEVKPDCYLWDGNAPLSVLGENQESVDALFGDSRVVKTLLNHSGLINAIHLTDQRFYSKFDLVLKAHLRLDQVGMKAWRQLARDVLYMADYVSRMRVGHKV